MYSILQEGDEGDDDELRERDETKRDETDEAMELVGMSTSADDNGGLSRSSHDRHSHSEAVDTDGNWESQGERNKETNALRKDSKLRKINARDTAAIEATMGKRMTNDHYEEAMRIQVGDTTRRTLEEASATTKKAATEVQDGWMKSKARQSAPGTSRQQTRTTTETARYTTRKTAPGTAEATTKTALNASKKTHSTTATGHARVSFEPQRTGKSNNQPVVETVDITDEDAEDADNDNTFDYHGWPTSGERDEQGRIHTIVRYEFAERRNEHPKDPVEELKAVFAAVFRSDPLASMTCVLDESKEVQCMGQFPKEETELLQFFERVVTVSDNVRKHVTTFAIHSTETLQELKMAHSRSLQEFLKDNRTYLKEHKFETLLIEHVGWFACKLPFAYLDRMESTCRRRSTAALEESTRKLKAWKRKSRTLQSLNLVGQQCTNR
jgi:hypothetical protein